jgi:hypothetical protein
LRGNGWAAPAQWLRHCLMEVAVRCGPSPEDPRRISCGYAADAAWLYDLMWLLDAAPLPG